MMGQQSRTESLFYYFRSEEHIPADHLLRMIDSHVDSRFARIQRKDFCSPTTSLAKLMLRCLKYFANSSALRSLVCFQGQAVQGQLHSL
jgi:hypothetical protein